MKEKQHLANRPNQYRGKLDVAGIVTGMNAAVRSARRLLADAELLQKSGRHPSAAALAILSIEESGKTRVLRLMSIAPDYKTLRDAWRDYRRHTSKNTHWVVGELIEGGARQLRDFRPAVESGDSAEQLNAVKQLAVYSDCYGDNAHWSEPGEAITAELAGFIIQQARIVLPAREVAQREMELWVEQVGPSYATPAMGTAVIAWYAALKAEGLTEIEPDDVARFMDDLA